MLEESERKVNLKKIFKHELQSKLEKEQHENRVRIEKIQLIDDFLAAMNRARSVEKRVPLIVRTQSYIALIITLQDANRQAGNRGTSTAESEQRNRRSRSSQNFA